MEKQSQSEAKRRVMSMIDIMQKTPEHARNYFSTALDYHKNDSSALLYLGLMELTGTGGGKNVPDGIAHLQQSADAGEVDALFILGSSYFWGDDVEQDYGKAFPLLLKAAELGHVEACNYVAECYKDGTGVKQDMSEALDWLTTYVEMKNAAEDGKGSVEEDSALGDLDLLEEGAAAYLLLQANGLNPDDYSPWSDFNLCEYRGKGTDASDPFVIRNSSNAVSYENQLIEFLSSEGVDGGTSFEILDSEIHWDGNTTAIDYVHFRVYEESLEEYAESILLYDKTLFFDVTEMFTSYIESLGSVLPKCPMVYSGRMV